jgi:hypothetical protein
MLDRTCHIDTAFLLFRALWINAVCALLVLMRDPDAVITARGGRLRRFGRLWVDGQKTCERIAPNIDRPRT